MSQNYFRNISYASRTNFEKVEKIDFSTQILLIFCIFSEFSKLAQYWEMLKKSDFFIFYANFRLIEVWECFRTMNNPQKQLRSNFQLIYGTWFWLKTHFPSKNAFLGKNNPSTGLVTLKLNTPKSKFFCIFGKYMLVL